MNSPIPLIQSASMLGRFCDILDAQTETEEDITLATRELFAGLRANLALSVDEHVKFKNGLDGLIMAAEYAVNYWRTRRNKVRMTLESYKKEVLDVMKSEPNVPYKGNLGNLRIQKNGGKEKLLTKFSMRDDVTISNVVDVDELDLFGVPYEFREEMVITRVNTDKIRAFLKTDKLPWAELERGEHVRFS